MDSSHFIAPTLRRATKAWQAQAGFTLIEMMVVVAIVGVIAGIAVPGYQKLSRSMAISSATSTLMGHLKQARHLAVSQNRSVSVAISSNQYVFDSGANSNNKNQSVTIAQFSKKGITLQASSTYGAGSTGTITFTSQGSVNHQGHICIASDGIYKKRITLNTIGRAYFCNMTQANCLCP